VNSNSVTLKKVAQLALLTNRLPSEILGLHEESLMLFELDYLLLSKALMGEDSDAAKLEKMKELLRKRGKKVE